MSNESTVWNILPENSTEIPLEAEEQKDGYVLLLVIVSVFLVGTLVFISVFLIAYRRSCRGGQLCARASDDPEKTTTCMEESQPTHEITIRVDESDCLSMASYHDQETERFLSTGPTGRRVSFNEAALFDHGKKTQEKGRRYTLTEGDFHHLKNARLTHLSIPPPALKIVTIHECDSAENTITMTTRPATKSALSIFQPMLCPLPQTALSSLSVNPSCALPGDALNSVVDSSFCEKPAALSTKEPIPSSIEMMGAGPRGRGSSISVGDGTVVGNGASPAGGGAGSPRPVLQFLTKLRRHASLEGASPYFKIKKWKLDSSQRASSLDTRGSPKRRQFQRQRAASESMDQDDNDAHHIDLIQYIARTQDAAYRPSQPPARLASHPSTPPPSLGRVEVEVMVEPSCSRGGPGVIGLSPDPQEELLSVVRSEGANPSNSLQPQDPQSLYRDIWTLRATLEQYAASDQSSNIDRSSVCSDADSVCSLGGRTERGGLPSYPSQDLGDEAEAGEEDKDFLVYMDEKLRVQESRKRKQGSTESDRGGSDVESGTRKLLQMDSGYASIEAPSRGPEELRLFGNGSPTDRTAHEKRNHFTNAGRTGTIGESFESYLVEEEPEEELLMGASGGVSIKAGAGSLSWLPYGQMLTPREAAQPPPPPLTLHRRDYSIDEKTDALFHEFLRHDPQFDQQESPRKHRSRVHLRKQWQRHKQWSDPGVRHFHSSFERQRTPLRRGDSVNYPLDTSYHSTLPRIVSAPDEETSDGTGSTPDTPKVEQAAMENGAKNKKQGVSIIDSEDHTSSSPPPPHPSISEKDGRLLEHSDPLEDRKQSACPPEPLDERSPPQRPDSSGYGPQTVTAELTDKLTANLDERLYTGLRRTIDTATECVTATATHASPDHSPV
ncbi:voltage-dependent calcium channel beta subunit-associated regulatory protein isoform 1-T5 [Odontesthes bonariensis]|uniref:voltage-dependent calcium channel beta subunit-associated regulatory protein n=1 Tax=Odontesthes bonariensis TaxID=219752 RepID=UPI003F58E81D